MSRYRAIFCVLLALMPFEMAAPASAQVMPTRGIDIPWFRSASERAQRETCRRNLPECRAAVRAQMAFEQSITIALPWVALAFAILGVLFWLRKKEKERERKKKLARMHHVPGTFKNLDKDPEPKPRGANEEPDRLA